MSNSNITAPTQFLQTPKEKYAYRRFGKKLKYPLLFLQHFTGTLDNWDPAVTDPLAADHDVVVRQMEDAILEINIADLQRTQLASPSAGDSGQPQIQGHRRMRPTALSDHLGDVLRSSSGHRSSYYRRRLGGLRRVPGDPLPAFRCGKGTGQDVVDIPDRLRRQWPAHMRLTPGPLAVMAPAACSTHSPTVYRDVTGHDCGPALPEDNEPFLG